MEIEERGWLEEKLWEVKISETWRLVCLKRKEALTLVSVKV